MVESRSAGISLDRTDALERANSELRLSQTELAKVASSSEDDTRMKTRTDDMAMTVGLVLILEGTRVERGEGGVVDVCILRLERERTSEELHEL